MQSVLKLCTKLQRPCNTRLVLSKTQTLDAKKRIMLEDKVVNYLTLDWTRTQTEMKPVDQLGIQNVRKKIQ